MSDFEESDRMSEMSDAVSIDYEEPIEDEEGERDIFEDGDGDFYIISNELNILHEKL
jgi:hypothetical protein